ncbi:helix-turn-helix transcriptional regulator [Nocardia sp. Marseille-Q1738]
MDELLTTGRVETDYSIPAGTLRYYRHNNTGPASFRLGRRVVYRRSAVEAWIAAQEAASTRGGMVPDGD